jgi:predicted dehydrogenase
MTRTSRRTFLQQGLIAGGAAALSAGVRGAPGAGEHVNLGMIGLGWRGATLLDAFEQVSGVNIAGICDADSAIIDQQAARYPKATRYVDLRRMLDSPDIDAVVISTGNHWHCLAAIWAMQAGKHVYVEKPLCNALWEGRQVVNAAAKYGKICQVGTQQRSAPMQAEIKHLLHDEKLIGDIQWVRVNRFGLRPSIGKRATPLVPPKSVDYDLWLGPAQDQPIYRDKFHYDWHWDWNTGAGEMGNWGVHIVDDVRNNVFRDATAFPKSVVAGGGRFAWHDAGTTPNIHFAMLDTGSIPVVIGVANIAADAENKKPPVCPGPASGYIAYGSAGRMEGERGKAKFFDTDGTLIREIKGTTGMVDHQQNFVDAIRNSSPGSLMAPAEVGHHSTAWCNLANYAYRVASEPGSQGHEDAAFEVKDVDAAGTWSELRSLVAVHEGQQAADAMRLGPRLAFDSTRETFVGDHADVANRYLRVSGRNTFVVPAV